MAEAGGPPGGPAAAAAPAAPAAAAAASSDTLADQLWGQKKSVRERWPDLADSQMMEQIDKVYEKVIQTRPWFDSNGDAAISGALSNKRVIVVAQKKYSAKIWQIGLRMEQRGTPEGFIPEENQEHTLLLSGKQLAGAVYRNFRTSPNHPLMIEIKQKGYPVYIRSNKLPWDVQVCIVDNSNLFHGGQAKTLSEILRLVPDIQADWHESKGHISSRGQAKQGVYSYAALYWKFVKDTYGKEFPWSELWSETKTLVNLLEGVVSLAPQTVGTSLLEVLVQLLDNRCDTSQHRASKLVSLLLAWARIWVPWREKYTDKLLWEAFFVVGCEATCHLRLNLK
jgi:hypothetical protein